jgi:hypothetical protein
MVFLLILYCIKIRRDIFLVMKNVTNGRVPICNLLFLAASTHLYIFHAWVQPNNHLHIHNGRDAKHNCRRPIHALETDEPA